MGEIELGVLITRGPVWVRIRGIDLTPKGLCELELGVLITKGPVWVRIRGIDLPKGMCELELGVLIYQRVCVS